MLIDSHAHLDDERYANQLDAIIERAKAANVGHVITIATNLESAKQGLALAKSHSFLSCTAGVHPHDAKELNDEQYNEIARLAGEESAIVAIGETGLDYYYDLSCRDKQRDSFRKHVELGRQVKKPLVIHVRDSYDDTIDILKEVCSQDPVHGVIHCFTGNLDQAKVYLDMGLYISFSGIVTFKNAAQIQEVAAYVPDDRFLVETDSPYLAPVPHRGKDNEPAFVSHVAAMVASLRGQSEAEVAALATQNTLDLFSLSAEVLSVN